MDGVHSSCKLLVIANEEGSFSMGLVQYNGDLVF